MKKILLTCCLLLTAYCFTSFAQSFEGKIVLRAENTTTKEVSDITWYLKNGNHLLNYVNTGSGINNTYSLLSTAGKLEMINERGRVNIPGNSLKKTDYDFTTYKLLNKEGNKMLNEFTCVKYMLESGNNVAEVWMTDYEGLKSTDFPEIMQSSLLKACDNLHQGGIPIQIKVSDKSNNLLFLQTITYIMPCKVGDEKFK